MREKIRGLIRSDFAVSSFYSAIATVIKLGTMLLMSKIVAVYLGKSGLGLIGQLTSFVTIVLALAGGCINIGVIKYTAQYAATDKQKLETFFKTGLLTVVGLGVTCGLVLIAFARSWAGLILTDPSYADVFILFGITVLFYGLNTYLVSVINGLKQYKLLNIINIITSISGLALSYYLIVTYNIRGAFYAIVTNQSIIFFVTWFIARKQHVLSSINLKGAFSRHQLKLLSGFILMALVSTAFVPVVQLLIRDRVITGLGLSAAGIWEAICRISNVHLLFITTTLSTYYLPRLSEIQETPELKREIWKMLKVIVPLVIFSSTVIYLCRYLVISVLFTKDFNEAGVLFGWQLAGDVIKTAAWIIGFQMHARAMTKTFIISEIAGGLTYLALSVFFIGRFGLTGTVMAYAVNYFLYFIALLFIFNKILFAKSVK